MLLAGALATVVACIGVCPAEAVRIRCVSKKTPTDNSEGGDGALATLKQMVGIAGRSYFSIPDRDDFYFRITALPCVTVLYFLS